MDDKIKKKNNQKSFYFKDYSESTIIVKDEPAAREAAVAELARGCIQGRGTQLVAAISDGVRVMTETVGTAKVRIGS